MEDFEHLLTIFRAGFFATQHTLLVMNENLVRAGKTPLGAFDKILARPELIEMDGAGVKIMRMPRLNYMDQVRRTGLNFYDVAAGKRGKEAGRQNPLCQFEMRSWIKAWNVNSRKMTSWSGCHDGIERGGERCGDRSS